MSLLLDKPTEEDWKIFESKFNVSKEDVVQVKNIFRHHCKLYIFKSDVIYWDQKYVNNDLEKISKEINVYHYSLNLKNNINNCWCVLKIVT